MSLTLIETEVLVRLRSYRLNPNSPIGIAFSGGLDSTALAAILMQLRRVGSIENPVVLLYVRHKLRNLAETETEERMVLHHALSWKSPLYIGEDEWHKESGGLEARAREYRYRLLNRWYIELNLGGILTAHHLDDQVETQAMEFFGGGGWRSNLGIPETRPPYYRPLIDTQKKHLRRYLVENGLSWSEDSSNLEKEIPRNFFRSEIIPLLRERIPSLDLNLRRGRTKTQLLDDWINAYLARNHWQVRSRGTLYVDLNSYCQAPHFLRYELLLSGLSVLEKNKKDSHFRDLFDSRSTRRRRVSFEFLKPVIFVDCLCTSDKMNRKIQGYGTVIEFLGTEILLKDELEFSEINGYGFYLDSDTKQNIYGGILLGPRKWAEYREKGGKGTEILLPKDLETIRCHSEGEIKKPTLRTKKISILSKDAEPIVRIEPGSQGYLHIWYTDTYTTLLSLLETEKEKCGVVSWMEYSSER